MRVSRVGPVKAHDLSKHGRRMRKRHRWSRAKRSRLSVSRSVEWSPQQNPLRPSGSDSAKLILVGTAPRNHGRGEMARPITPETRQSLAPTYNPHEETCGFKVFFTCIREESARLGRSLPEALPFTHENRYLDQRQGCAAQIAAVGEWGSHPRVSASRI